MPAGARTREKCDTQAVPTLSVDMPVAAMIEQSGNIYVAAGIAHNLAYIEPAFVVGYNEEPTVLDPQPYELVTRIIATEEFGMSEAFDEYACDMQTAA